MTEVKSKHCQNKVYHQAQIAQGIGRYRSTIGREVKQEKWSPDTVVSSLKRKGKFNIFEMVFTKTLYSYVNRGYCGCCNIDLPLKTRRKQRKSTNRKHKLFIPKGKAAADLIFERIS